MRGAQPRQRDGRGNGGRSRPHRRPRLVFQAIAYDPLTAAVLSLAEIKAMVNEMLAQNREHLPQFKRFEA